MNEARRRTKRVWDVVTAIYSEQTGTRSNEDTEEVDRHKHTCWEQSNGRKCLIDMAVRGVQRPGCSRGNKNRRGSCFMLYILLISCNNTAVGIRERERERRKSDGLPHGLLDDDISSDNGGHTVHEHLSTWSWRQKKQMMRIWHHPYAFNFTNWWRRKDTQPVDGCHAHKHARIQTPSMREYSCLYLRCVRTTVGVWWLQHGADSLQWFKAI